MQSHQPGPEYQVMQDENQGRQDENAVNPQSRFNTEDARYCFKKNVKIGAITGAAMGGTASVAFLCMEAFNAGWLSSYSRYTTCSDGKAELVIVACMALPGAIAGAVSGAVVGSVTGGPGAVYAGFFGVPRCFDGRVPAQQINNVQNDNPAPAGAPEEVRMV